MADPMPTPPTYTERIVQGRFAARVQALAPYTRGGKNPDGTWSFEWTPEATQAQIDAANAFIASFDLAAEVAARDARAQALQADQNVSDMLDRIQNATPAQIDTWLTNNMTNIAQARNIIGFILKAMARQQGT